MQTFRPLAPYAGLLALALTLSYVGGLAARSSHASYDRDDGERRVPAAASTRTPASLGSMSEQAAFSSLLLGGAASVTQHQER